MWSDSIGAFGFWAMVAASAIGFWWAMSPVLKALANRINGRNPSSAQIAELETRIAQLEGRSFQSGEVESQFHHLAEIEERLDFAERMLAERHGDRLSSPSHGEASHEHRGGSRFLGFLLRSLDGMGLFFMAFLLISSVRCQSRPVLGLVAAVLVYAALFLSR